MKNRNDGKFCFEDGLLKWKQSKKEGDQIMKKLWDGIFEWRWTIAFLVAWMSWGVLCAMVGAGNREKISVSHSELVDRGIGYYDENQVFRFYAMFEYATQPNFEVK